MSDISQRCLHDRARPTSPCELILGTSAAIQRVRELAEQIARWQIPVLIEGPTGAGKELVAQVIHVLSRRGGEMVALNVSTLPETLFEAMVFGHTRGAFTGAHHDAPGYVLEADRGTLFLDEISTLPVALQAKLLRVLDTHLVRQVGGKRDRASDFRLISATNDDLAGLVAASRFRRDLFYRLRGAVIVVPSLLQRLEDVPLLARHFAACVAERVSLPYPVLRPDAMLALADHSWPGNVRELRQVMELAFVLADGGAIGAREINEAIGRPHPSLALIDKEAPASEIGRLRELMIRHDWIVASAARELDVTPKTVYSRLQRAGIKLPRRGAVMRSLAERALQNGAC